MQTERKDNSSDVITIQAVAPAKVNLRLRVIGRFDNGYHALSMFNVRVSLADELTLRFVPGNGKVEVHAKGAYGVAGTNICERAAIRFLEEFVPSPTHDLYCEINKNIPIGAGLGGGSSDAATLLLALKDFYKLPSIDLYPLAKELGADVPFSLFQQSALVEGIGEKITGLPTDFLTGVPMLLIFPREHIPTKNIFTRLSKQQIESAQDRELQSFSKDLEITNDSSAQKYQKVLQLIANDLVPFAKEESSTLSRLLVNLSTLKDVVVGMSGSGSCCFVLAADLSTADKILTKIKGDYSSENDCFLEKII